VSDQRLVLDRTLDLDAFQIHHAELEMGHITHYDKYFAEGSPFIGDGLSGLTLREAALRRSTPETRSHGHIRRIKPISLVPSTSSLAQGNRAIQNNPLNSKSCS
jgi:hypothetical protein